MVRKKEEKKKFRPTRSKTTAILLAFAFSGFSWLYTYKTDGFKFAWGFARKFARKYVFKFVYKYIISLFHYIIKSLFH